MPGFGVGFRDGFRVGFRVRFRVEFRIGLGSFRVDFGLGLVFVCFSGGGECVQGTVSVGFGMV